MCEGYKGEKGKRGRRGPSGPQGESGLQGPQGIMGEIGLPGFPVSSPYYYIPVHGNTTLLSSHRGCSKDQIRPTLVLRPSTKLSLLVFRQF